MNLYRVKSERGATSFLRLGQIDHKKSVLCIYVVKHGRRLEINRLNFRN